MSFSQRGLPGGLRLPFPHPLTHSCTSFNTSFKKSTSPPWEPSPSPSFAPWLPSGWHTMGCDFSGHLSAISQGKQSRCSKTIIPGANVNPTKIEPHCSDEETGTERLSSSLRAHSTVPLAPGPCPWITAVASFCCDCRTASEPSHHPVPRPGLSLQLSCSLYGGSGGGPAPLQLCPRPGHRSGSGPRRRARKGWPGRWCRVERPACLPPALWGLAEGWHSGPQPRQA